MKKSKDIDTDNLPLEAADDEENDDELPDCANEAMQNIKQSKPKQHLKPRIIRSVRFNVKSHPEKHYHELIMLFTSWRNEETDLIGNSPSYQERFLFLKDKIDKWGSMPSVVKISMRLRNNYSTQITLMTNLIP